MSAISPPPEVVDAFHLMWDNFPEPVSLVHKSRQVVAVNKAHFFRPGTNCARTGRNGPHTGCLANRAMEGKAAVQVAHASLVENKELITYWLPLDGFDDYFLHLSIRIAIDYDAKTFALSPLADAARENYGYLWDGEKQSCAGCGE